MKKTVTLVLSGLTASFIAVSAIVHADGLLDFHPALKTSDTPESTSGLKKLYGPIAVDASRLKTSALVVESETSASGRRAAQTGESGKIMWANLIHRDGWDSQKSKRGLYAVNMETGEMTLLTEPEENLNGTGTPAYFNGGAAVIDRQFYGVNANFSSYSSYGVISGYLYQFDIEDWAQAPLGKFGYFNFTKNRNIAVETATDQKTGTVYGEFYASPGYELGTITYKGGQPERTSTIGSLTRRYAALGIDSRGTIYGVATDGNLYRISSTDATETLVGETGVGSLVIPESDASEYYLQGGEIDQSDDTFYWSSMSSDGKSVMYKVDLVTGAATRLFDVEGNAELIALTVPPAEAADDAPAEVTDLEISFDGPSKKGKASFTAPDRTFAGKTLGGKLQYTIYANKKSIAVGNTTPGQKTVANIELPEDGLVRFAVATSNSAGESPKAFVTLYVGYDEPVAPADVKLTVDENLKASVSWTASDKGLNDGYLGEITYNLKRVEGVDTVVVAEGLTATTFEEQLEDKAARSCFYIVTAVNGTNSSAPAASNAVSVGSIQPPYFETFDSAQNFSSYTVVDANGDGNTWKHGSGEALYKTFRFSGSNDWLITPGMRLKNGNKYIFTFSACTDGNSAALDSYWGEAPTVEGMTNEITKRSVGGRKLVHYSDTIKVEKDGLYNFGLHLSSSMMRECHVDSIRVELCPGEQAPDSVTGFTVEADETNPLKAHIRFKAPVKSILGEDLNGRLEKIEILCDDAVIYTLTDIDPGTAIEYTDESTAKAGFRTWQAVAYMTDTEEGKGRPSESRRIYLGWDTPLAVDGVKLADLGNQLNLTWNPATAVGVNGGRVDLSQMKYNVMTGGYDAYIGFMPDPDNLAVTSETNFSMDFDSYDGPQGWIYLGVRPSNGTGLADVSSDRVFVGAPYANPFVENFVRDEVGSLAHYWTKSSDEIEVKFSSESADGDNSSLAIAPATEQAASGEVFSGRFSVADLDSPALYFALKASDAKSSSLGVYALKIDGSRELLADFNDISDEFDYVFIPLEKLKDQKAFRLIFSANFEGILGSMGEGKAQIVFDDVRIATLPDRNIALTSLDTPSSMTMGSANKVNVTVRNLGRNPINSYSVAVTADGGQFGQVDIDETLKPLDQRTYKFSYTPSVFTDSDTDIEIAANVTYADDLNTADNTLTEAVDIIVPQVSGPEDLKAEKTDNGIFMSWSAPEVSSVAVMETFDDAEPWSVDHVAGWEFINANNSTAAQIFSGFHLPNEHTAYAYTVADFTQFWDDGYLDGHSGHQYLFSPQRNNSDYTSKSDADNWLISPILSGSAQTVSFWVLNQPGDYSSVAETYEVLYSTTGTDLEDFVKIGDTHEATGGVWTKTEVDLPDGALYFAIRQTTPYTQSLMFGIDDVTYKRYGSLSHFNVYVDGEYQGNTFDTIFSLSPSRLEKGTHTLAVTCVYGNGMESMPASVEFTVDNSGIATIITDADNAHGPVITIDGKVLPRGTSYRPGPGIYIIDGKKVNVK